MNDNIFQGKRLNGYDLNMLSDTSLKEPDNEGLKLEYIINEKEEELANLNNKIKGRELLGKLLDVMELRIQAKKLENEIAQLKSEYAKHNIKDRITAQIAKPKVKISPLKVMARFITRKIFAKISKKFKSIADIGDSLDLLTSINDNVDELIAMKVPYGETKANYEKLTNSSYKKQYSIYNNFSFSIWNITYNRRIVYNKHFIYVITILFFRCISCLYLC